MMAMDSDVLGLALAKVIIERSTIPPTPDMVIDLQIFWKDMAKEIVDHIKNNAEVPAGIAVVAGSESGATVATGKVT
jgi:hypothetical protein